MKLKDLIPKINEDFSPAEEPVLSVEDKKALIEKVRNYASYGKALYSEHDLVEIANELSQIAEKAEIYTLSETEDQFDKITINRNIKELKSLSGQFSKVAGEAKALKERMSGLYEDMGNILNRYFEVNDEGIIDEDEVMGMGDKEDQKSKLYSIIHSSEDEDEVEWAKKELDNLR